MDSQSTANTDAAQQYIDSQTGPTVPFDRDAVYTQLDAFTEADPEFQSGLDAILGPLTASGATPDQLLQTKQRAKVFFFMSKTGTEIDFDDYTSWLSSRAPAPAPAPTAPSSSSNPSAATDGATAAPAAPHDKQEPYPASFDSIVELIATGQTDKIAGIRDIPLVINEEEPTKPSLSRPLKPWEKAADDQAQDPAEQTNEAAETTH
ncbi:uncharacterized protein PFL1_01279 [Pseudozyma flocculosa PF-1]|uniref:Uncharacterized protein n=1 Tax=Pseudozyma flocculosa TaxID=84751 RepID=A0A5C3EW13_9BASI|nr:uncharacterized protein PFL1_01279 [Pseudozyma flocculosa PF-1]EPQ31090.1 hypothetical protein PFL1_01279 [Pseudozyma flocculosa PF-1]SPO35945.1 uncharacterized protein PSFLO_01416 [Pseudozyma flocculosa]